LPLRRVEEAEAEAQVAEWVVPERPEELPELVRVLAPPEQQAAMDRPGLPTRVTAT
jgi:hypothetical protein